MDNSIALSGTKGAIIDMAQLPDSLGDTPEERIMKFTGYRKVGISLINSAQEGQSLNNTFYGGFDDTLQPGTIQAY
jgi:hypothetical protein